MKLITFQSLEAVNDLFKKGYLECDKSKINLKKYGLIYKWLITRMNENINNKYSTLYPIWCWVKCYNGICPPKRRGNKIKGFDVKITFNKKEKDVFITDFRRYSFLLSNTYIPNNLKDKEEFEKLLIEYNITEEELKAYVRKDEYDKHRTDKEYIDVCDKIRKSFDRCITNDSDVLQGCVWRINIDEIEKIEILNDNEYMYGSLNYIRSNGKRINWIDEYYKMIKNKK